MSSGFRRFLERLRGDAALRGQARLPDARFQPPPVPPATWHSVRDDLEQTLDSLRELRGVLTRYQRALDEMERRAAGDSAGVPGERPAEPRAPQGGPAGGDARPARGAGPALPPDGGRPGAP